MVHVGIRANQKYEVTPRETKDVFVLQWLKRAVRVHRWMPRHKTLMKDVAACDKLRGGGKQPLIRRFPNGETWYDVESYRNPERSGAQVPAEVKHLSKPRKRKKHQSLFMEGTSRQQCFEGTSVNK